MKKRYNISGMVLMELIIVIIMINILFFSAYFIYNVAISSWQIGTDRTKIIPQARICIEKMAQDLMQAIEFRQINLSSLKFKVKEGGKEKIYFYYLYNKEDPWPNPPNNKDSYDLRKCDVTENFKYGCGRVVATNVKSLIYSVNTNPTDSVKFSLALGKEKNEEFQLFTTIKARNAE